MKKSLLALAVLGAFAGAASAQTNVTIYGVVDAGYVKESGGAASVSKISSGVKNGSRIGFKGTEDLGGGLSAKFQIEQGILADTGASAQGGLTYGRQAWVGLAGGFGQISLGRQYTPLFGSLNDVDPFGTGLAGQSNNIMLTGGTRANNAFNWSSANMGGFTANFQYGFGEVAGNTSALRNVGLSGKYANGPLVLTAAYHRTNNAAATGGDTHTTLLGGTYDFGAAKVHLGYALNDGDTNTATTMDRNDLLLGVTVPVGAGTFLASYVRADDRMAANRDANQWGVGYIHNLSKRTNIYTAYGHIKNKNGAAYTVGNATEGGSGNKAFQVGFQNWF